MTIKFLQKTKFGIGILLLSTLVPLTWIKIPASAFEPDSESFSMPKAPHLVEAKISHREPNVSSTYKFTISIPEHGTPIRAVEIVQRANFERIDFDLSRTRALARSKKSESETEVIILRAADNQERDSNSIKVVFVDPVKSGTDLTIEIVAKHNPRFGGIYVFDAIAFVSNQGKEFSLNLGSTRVDFERAGD